MRITAENYEAFFLDYHEGSLNLQQVAELMIFLEENPALKEAFEAFENIKVKADEFVSLSRSALKKIPANYNELLIGHLEGSLSDKEEKRLQDLLSSEPKFESELNLFKQTILVPDPNIIFENKDSLKKNSKGRIINLYYYVSAAASVAVIIGLYLFFSLGQELKIAQIEKRQIPFQKFESHSTVIANVEKPAVVEVLAKGRAGNKKVKPQVIKEQKNSNLFAATDSANLIQIAINVPVKVSDSVSMEAPVFKTISAAYFKKEKIVEEKKSPLWNLAVLCSKGINRLTGRKLELKKEIAPDSSRIEYFVTAGRFGFSRSYSNNYLSSVTNLKGGRLKVIKLKTNL
jgi:hypothetical protein